MGALAPYLLALSQHLPLAFASVASTAAYLSLEKC